MTSVSRVYIGQGVGVREGPIKKVDGHVCWIYFR